MCMLSLFSGWRSTVLYHRKEYSDLTIVKYVSVVRLDFEGQGVSCEGAGLVEEFLDSGRNFCLLTNLALIMGW